jgi:hypothetical protein
MAWVYDSDNNDFTSIHPVQYHEAMAGAVEGFWASERPPKMTIFGKVSG